MNDDVKSAVVKAIIGKVIQNINESAQATGLSVLDTARIMSGINACYAHIYAANKEARLPLLLTIYERSRYELLGMIKIEADRHSTANDEDKT